MKHKKIVKFLDELREASDDMYEVFTIGSCFRLYKILKTLRSDAKPYWSELDGHCVTKIGKRYYDIGGEIKPAYIDMKEYYIIEDNTKGYGLLKYKSEGRQRTVGVTRYV